MTPNEKDEIDNTIECLTNDQLAMLCIKYDIHNYVIGSVTNRKDYIVKTLREELNSRTIFLIQDYE